MNINNKQSLDENLTFAKELALQAGKRIVNLVGNHIVTTKKDGTILTNADKESDEFICNKIQSKYPKDNILSEESTENYNNCVDNLWIIDPLDGSTNYSQGLPIWGVSISKFFMGSPIIAVLYFPKLDLLCYASKDQGAFTNEKRISTQNSPIVNRHSIFTCTSGTERHYKIRGDIRAKRRTFGSTIYELYLVANGNALFSILPKPKIWDLAAAALIIKESGGEIDLLETFPLFPISKKINYEKLTLPTLATASKDIWKEISIALQNNH